MDYLNKTRLLIAGTGQVPGALRASFQKSAHISAERLDTGSSSELAHYLQTLKELPEIVLLVNFNSILPAKMLDERINWLNLHAGILPKYRGFHANAWAILKNENSIGYTIHQVIERFDAGPIYYLHRMPISPQQTYGDVRPLLLAHIIETAPKIIESIVAGQILPVAQNEAETFYCKKLSAEFGYISSWAQTSHEIYNVFRVMAAPLGTGIYTRFRNQRLDIEQLLLDDVPRPSSASPGTIIEQGQDGGVVVKTLDSSLLIKKILHGDRIVAPADHLKVGDLLGE